MRVTRPATSYEGPEACDSIEKTQHVTINHALKTNPKMRRHHVGFVVFENIDSLPLIRRAVNALHSARTAVVVDDLRQTDRAQAS
jgi:hypothetical protein